MKLIADIARKAILQGERSTLYRNAAQSHANAFWVYFIISALTWWFFNSGWSLLPLFLAVYVAIKSIFATQVAIRMESHENRPPAP